MALFAVLLIVFLSSKKSLTLRCWKFCVISVESCRPQPKQTVRKGVWEGIIQNQEDLIRWEYIDKVKAGTQ